MRARVVMIAAGWLVAGAVAHACPICFQVGDDPVVDGVRAAIGVLMAVTAGVLTGIVAFAVRVLRRSAPVPAVEGER
jgi:hypothetical protein